MSSPLHDGMWAGRRAFVVGGGPSLRGFDWSLLDHECWIGCNKAFTKDPPVALVGDASYQRALADVEEWAECPSVRVFLDRTLRPDIAVGAHEMAIPKHVGGWSHSLAEGLIGGDTGLMALNLADILGANPIYLLGIDMQGEQGRTANWHDGYGRTSEERVYWDNFMKRWVRHAPSCRARVVNLNPASFLRVFPRAPLESVLCRA